MIALLIPLAACGRGDVAPTIDNLAYLSSIVDQHMPGSDEGYTRDVTADVCPYVTLDLFAALGRQRSFLDYEVQQRRLPGEEPEVKVGGGFFNNRSIVIWGPGTDGCSATVNNQPMWAI